jgi:hypothetical protein
VVSADLKDRDPEAIIRFVIAHPQDEEEICRIHSNQQ